MAATTGPSEDADGGTDALLDEARTALRVERRRIVDEREAFRTLRSRVDSIGSETLQRTGANGSASHGLAERTGAIGSVGSSSASPGSGLVAVRNAYEETVMSVPHYEIEYDDTYERSVAAEFGPELAYALTRTSRFHAKYKRSLVDAIGTAIEEREAFLETVRTEAESIDRAESRLSPIEDEIETMATAERDGEEFGFGTLDAYRNRTTTLMADCDRIAARRQRLLADHDRDLRLGDDLDLPTYLYADLSVTYPVLAAVGRVGDRLDDVKRRIERAMADAE